MFSLEAMCLRIFPRILHESATSNTAGMERKVAADVENRDGSSPSDTVTAYSINQQNYKTFYEFINLTWQLHKPETYPPSYKRDRAAINEGR